MAKILVADDNSNIQKMVGLALKDHGIEVLAVGNGEAAVRKISDVRPDLVLADVFMPVRNGYEVCSYVKEDKALAHIPVILLVGAFDPLDEQEAQRVGADGVLKKPFVPPDPLISMVKSALVRAGVAHTGFSPAKPAAETAPEPPVAAPPRPSAPAIEVLPKTFDPQAETESFVDEVPVAPAALKIEPGQQPVAFGSLLEAPASEANEEPEEMTAPVGMGMERDWRSAQQDEEEEEESSRGSWRRDGSNESFVEQGEHAASSEIRGRHHEPWTPTREKSDITEASEPEPVESVPVGMLDRRDLPSGSPFAGEAWEAALDTHSDRKTAVAEAEHPEVHAADLERLVGHAPEPVLTEELATEPSVEEERARQARFSEEQSEEAAQVPAEPDSVAELPQVATEPENAPEQPAPVQASESGPSPAGTTRTSPSTASSWFSTPPSPWEAEAQKASHLASSWDLLIPPPSDLMARGDVTFEPPAAPVEIEIVPGTRLRSEVSAAAVETVRDETAQAVEQQEHQQGVEVNSASDPGQTTQENPAAPAIDMDAVVAKVIARLSPGVLEGVTRDILKPLIEAVVREELESKKS